MSDWIFVCPTSQLLPGEKTVVWADDTPILVVNLDGDIYALEDRCTHDEFELSSGEVDAVEGSIACVLHGARFDIREGTALCAPAYDPVAKFPVKVEDGLIWTRDDRD